MKSTEVIDDSIDFNSRNGSPAREYGAVPNKHKPVHVDFDGENVEFITDEDIPRMVLSADEPEVVTTQRNAEQI